MRLIDLSGQIFDGQQGHLQTVVRDFKTIDPVKNADPSQTRTFAVKVMTLSDHTGTHVDALAHFMPDAETIDAMPLDKFCGEAIVADFSAEPGSGEELTMEAFDRLMKLKNKTLRAGTIILFLLNAQDGRPVYSGISGNVARRLADAGIKLVGTNQGSIDWSSNRERPAHVTLLGKGIPIVEGLLNLDKVAKDPFTFFGLPLNIRGGTGSPIRAAALID